MRVGSFVGKWSKWRCTWKGACLRWWCQFLIFFFLFLIEILTILHAIDASLKPPKNIWSERWRVIISAINYFCFFFSVFWQIFAVNKIEKYFLNYHFPGKNGVIKAIIKSKYLFWAKVREKRSSHLWTDKMLSARDCQQEEKENKKFQNAIWYFSVLWL